jgi:hypothetical protein
MPISSSGSLLNQKAETGFTYLCLSVNQGRRALQVSNCNGEVVAHLPIEDEFLVSALASLHPLDR